MPTGSCHPTGSLAFLHRWACSGALDRSLPPVWHSTGLAVRIDLPRSIRPVLVVGNDEPNIRPNAERRRATRPPPGRSGPAPRARRRAGGDRNATPQNVGFPAANSGRTWHRALHFKGLAALLLGHARAGNIRIDISDPILMETLRVLREKFQWDGYMLHDARQRLLSISNHVTPTEKLSVIQEDPDDDRIVECAVAAKSDFIVSEDKDLLRVRAVWECPDFEYSGISAVWCRRRGATGRSRVRANFHRADALLRKKKLSNSRDWMYEFNLMATGRWPSKPHRSAASPAPSRTRSDFSRGNFSSHPSSACGRR